MVLSPDLSHKRQEAGVIRAILWGLVIGAIFWPALYWVAFPLWAVDSVVERRRRMAAILRQEAAAERPVRYVIPRAPEGPLERERRLAEALQVWGGRGAE